MVSKKKYNRRKSSQKRKTRGSGFFSSKQVIPQQQIDSSLDNPEFINYVKDKVDDDYTAFDKKYQDVENMTEKEFNNLLSTNQIPKYNPADRRNLLIKDKIWSDQWDNYTKMNPTDKTIFQSKPEMSPYKLQMPREVSF
jgi:hypothetical protein